MSTVVRIPEVLFERLRAYGQAFETPVDVVERLLTFYETHHPPSPRAVSATAAAAASPVPDLTHTKVITAQVGRVAVKGWNALKAEAFVQALRELSLDELKTFTGERVVPKRKDAAGWVFRQDANISIQDTDANTSYRLAQVVATRAGVPLTVEFEWADKPGAFRPGQRGRLPT
jgi:hypothetical protein